MSRDAHTKHLRAFYISILFSIILFEKKSFFIYFLKCLLYFIFFIILFGMTKLNIFGFNQFGFYLFIRSRYKASSHNDSTLIYFVNRNFVASRWRSSSPVSCIAYLFFCGVTFRIGWPLPNDKAHIVELGHDESPPTVSTSGMKKEKKRHRKASTSSSLPLLPKEKEQRAECLW